MVYDGNWNYPCGNNFPDYCLSVEQKIQSGFCEIFYSIASFADFNLYFMTI